MKQESSIADFQPNFYIITRDRDLALSKIYVEKDLVNGKHTRNK